MDDSKFEAKVKAVFTATPLNHYEIFEAWSRQIKLQKFVTARMLDYLFIIVRIGMMKEVSIVDVIKNNLTALLLSASDPHARVSNSPEIAALERLTAITMLRIQSRGPKAQSPHAVLSMRLFQLIGIFTGTVMSRGGVVDGIVLALANAIAGFLVAHVSELSMAGVLTMHNGKPPPLLKAAFSKAVPTFVQVLTSSGSPLAGTVTLLQQQSKLQEGMDDAVDDVVTTGVDNMAFNQVQPIDTHVAPTRASLYAYLTAALIATPRLDQVGLQVFLNARYQDDVKSMAVDLITASFDVLAGALERKESMEVIVIHRSFIANVLPSILEQITQFQSANHMIRKCVTEAIKKVEESYRNTNVLQPGSDACPRQRFLLACALFGFIDESAVPTLLGYPPTQGLSSAGRYDKAKLVQECQADPKRIEQLVGELHLMEGNAAAITRALLEIMHLLCANRDTMTLKMLCVAFLKKPHNINIMLLFFHFRTILQPLCQLLDHWQTPDEQGEQLIVYDEFGSILLFVVMCQYRYELAPSTFTTFPTDSFLLKYFQESALPKQSKDISDSERKQLTRWIKGLFEGNGLSDEILSACPPKEFYALMPTLMDQIMVATQAGVLGIEIAVAGVEYLLEPFLLPSLTIVFPLFAVRLSSMAADSSQLDFLMPLLMRLVRPPKLSPDAQPLHSAVLFISAKPLFNALTQIKTLHKNRRDVPQLIDALKNLVQKPFSLGAARPILEDWCSTKDPNTKEVGTALALRNSFDNLNKWNAPGKAVPDRQAYNHRLTVWAPRILSTRQALDIVLDQATKAATNPKATDQALDTLTGLIAASMLTVTDQRLTLRDALHRADHDAQVRPGAKEPSARNAFVMRLKRLVDLHCAKPVVQPPTIELGTEASAMVLDEAGQIGGLDPALAAAAVAQVDLKDIPMQDTQELLAGLADAAASGGNMSSQQTQQTQQSMIGGDIMGMGDMGDMQDMGFEDFLQDMGVSETQNFDDIFNDM